ncbi:ADP-ribosylglycohydrolase family protein [Brachybacterium hainanense]|uniref:ADP-ribosylglycohydrolase family protein n=1 Tax=Brachybacterium hainanense TaxID=1541174 RepID=A0ABV6RB26_9MICO
MNTKEQAGPGAGLDAAQRDRALGVVIAAATGDALGAPYEFQAPIPASDDVAMTGGGVLGWQPGEWTDDTAMAVVLLEAVAPIGTGFLDEEVLDRVARGWFSWSMSTPDIGALTSTVMRRASEVALAAGRTVPTAADFRTAALHAHEDLPQIAGNGALMRTHAAVLPHLRAGDDELQAAIEAVCRLTHVHVDVVDACLLWGFAVRAAVLTGEVDVRRGLGRLAPERRALWELRIEEAETAEPPVFGRNGWVVHAFQAAWSAIHHAGPIPRDKFARRDHLVAVLEAAVRAGYDTDTVACIAGALIGGAVGERAVPPEWRRVLSGWPVYEAPDLVRLAETVIG